MQGWHKNIDLKAIFIMSSLTQSEINQLVDSFEKVKNYCASTQTIDIKALKKLSNLNDEELEILIKLLK